MSNLSLISYVNRYRALEIWWYQLAPTESRLPRSDQVSCHIWLFTRFIAILADKYKNHTHGFKLKSRDQLKSTSNKLLLYVGQVIFRSMHVCYIISTAPL